MAKGGDKQTVLEKSICRKYFVKNATYVHVLPFLILRTSQNIKNSKRNK